MFLNTNRTVSLEKSRTIDNVQKHNICTNVPSLQIFKSSRYHRSAIYDLRGKLHVTTYITIGLPSMPKRNNFIKPTVRMKTLNQFSASQPNYRLFQVAHTFPISLKVNTITPSIEVMAKFLCILFWALIHYLLLSNWHLKEYFARLQCCCLALYKDKLP
jgi:hypothetical protein